MSASCFHVREGRRLFRIPPLSRSGRCSTRSFRCWIVNTSEAWKAIPEKFSSDVLSLLFPLYIWYLFPDASIIWSIKSIVLMIVSFFFGKLLLDNKDKSDSGHFYCYLKMKPWVLQLCLHHPLLFSNLEGSFKECVWLSPASEIFIAWVLFRFWSFIQQDLLRQSILYWY